MVPAFLPHYSNVGPRISIDRPARLPSSFVRKAWWILGEVDVYLIRLLSNDPLLASHMDGKEPGYSVGIQNLYHLGILMGRRRLPLVSARGVHR
jgi:hypothetical protein